MPLDINSLKETIRDTLRARLYPRCLSGSIEATLSTTVNVSIAQSFIPYTKFYSKKSLDGGNYFLS